jgi:hypothetical protein
MPEGESARLAVLIDADNTTPAAARRACSLIRTRHEREPPGPLGCPARARTPHRNARSRRSYQVTVKVVQGR